MKITKIKEIKYFALKNKQLNPPQTMSSHLEFIQPATALTSGTGS